MTTIIILIILLFFFFFNDTATTEIYTLSLHDALPISLRRSSARHWKRIKHEDTNPPRNWPRILKGTCDSIRSEEHTSELQSQSNLVCRLLLEKKKKKKNKILYNNK